MFLLFDMGATKTRLAFATSSKNFESPLIYETPPLYTDSLNLLIVNARKLIAGRPLRCIIGGVAGPFSQDRSTLVNSLNLKDYVGKPLRKDLAAAFATEVVLENDSALVGLGEISQNPKTHKGVAAYITVSTGVGGARFTNGLLDAHSFSFEPGRQIINFDGIPCTGCGQPGCLESYISGSSIERIYGKKPYEIKDRVFWSQIAHYLAIGLNNTILHWSPDHIILGGSMMKDITVEMTREHLQKLHTTFPRLPILLPAKLGDLGGLYGGLCLATHSISSS